MVSTWRKPRGGDQRGARALAFQDHVGGDRGAVQHMAERGGVRARPASSASIMPAMKACEGSDGTLGVLARQIVPARRVVQRDVGEGAADIDRDGTDADSDERIDIFIAVECLHGSAGRAQRGGAPARRPRSRR